jgi:RND family efflux transporter MFP subunit
MKTTLLLASFLILTSCGKQEARRAESTPGAPVAVRTATVSAVEWPNTYEATGTVRPRISAAISSKVMGYVQEVAVHVGDRVREGQTLVTLDARDLDSNLRRAQAGVAEVESAQPEVEHAIVAAKANLDLAQTTFRRIDGLAAKKSVSNQEFDEASARMKSAQAAYEMAVSKRAQIQSRVTQATEEQRSARILRDYTEIKAPFAGIVTEKQAEPGILASPGAPLLTLEREGTYRLEVAVDESRMPAVRVGQPVKVEVEGCPGQTRVSEVVPAVDAPSRSYTVKVDLPGCATVRSGAFGRAEFPLGARQVLAVPAAAMIERGQLQLVFVVENAIAHMRLITAGNRSGGSVEVLSGLNSGERIVVPVPVGLGDGARVEVRP